MTSSNTLLQLRQWLQNTFTAHRQPSDSEPSNNLFITHQFRHTVKLADAPMQQTKVLELGEQTLWLLVRSEKEGDCLDSVRSVNRVSVRVQLGSAEPTAILPTGIRLSLLSNSGDVVQSVTARDQDNGIQLRRFRCSIGTRFKLQVSLDSADLTERFIV
ncbi:DUF1822 family protein [Cyanobacteria bacterium FACHB-63]|nr:DUF1822 family protein [Cyanobacteria bacterium FACHB-63]